jgi:hypothetical protein
MCVSGAVVYAGGEIAVQTATRSELGVDSSLNWKRVGNIALLGSCGALVRDNISRQLTF